MNNSKIPTLRFPGFIGEWELKKLNNRCTFFSGGTPTSTKKEYYNGNIPFIGSGDIFKEDVDKYITEEALLNSSAKIVEKGDILYALYGANSGDVSLSNINGAINQAILCIRTKEDKDFLYQLLSYKKANIVSTYLQGGQGNLSSDIIKKLNFNFPTLQEQNKIGSFLKDIDYKITKLIRKKKLLEKYKKGVMQKIFSQELRFKDENGNEFPKWEEKKLGDIGAFQTSSVDKLSKPDEQKVYLVNYMNVYRHETISNETIQSYQVVTANEKQLKSSNLLKGDILFTPSSETPTDIGHSVVIFEDIKNTVYSYHLIRFRPSIKLNLMFSHYFCNTSDVLRQLSRFSTGSTRFTISIGNFSKVKVCYPCIEEQTKIANFLSDIDVKIEALNTKIENSKAFKKGLLQKMFV